MIRALFRWLFPGPARRYAILSVLSEGENYGLGIGDALEARGLSRLWPGPLYGILHALEREGLVTSREADPSPERGGRPRVYYRLTPAGWRALQG